MRQADEQYAWPRSHDAQIAKRRLQRRQTFWRSGVSTASARQRVPTGHGAQTVAQERRLARSVGASRRSPRVWRDQLQALTSFAAARSLRDPRAIAQSEEAVDAATPVDAQNAPTGVCKSRTEREIRTAPTALLVFIEKKKTKNELRHESKFTRFQVSADMCAECFDRDTKGRRAFRLGEAESRPDLPQDRGAFGHRSRRCHRSAAGWKRMDGDENPRLMAGSEMGEKLRKVFQLVGSDRSR